MQKWKRSIFFWVLALLFSVTAPMVILNARGYRFDINRGVFVYSGSITLKTNPQTVDVKLNEKTTESKRINRINSSYNIAGLIPQDYNMQVLADGFQAWSKKTDVHSGMANEFWNVVLVRESYEKEDSGLSGVGKFFISPKNDFLAAADYRNRDLAVKIFNLDSQSIDHEFSFAGWTFIDDERKENIEWSPEEEFLLVPAKKTIETSAEKNKLPAKKTEPEEQYAYFVADLEKNSSLNLNQFIGKDKIKNARWDPKKKGYLFFLEQNDLFRSNVSDARDIIKIASDVSAYDLSGNVVYYSSLKNNLIFKKSLDGKSEPIQLTGSFPAPESASISKMVVYDDSRIALILGNKDLYIFNRGEHNTYFRKLKEASKETHFSNDGKKLLFWSDFEISVYYLRDETSQPQRVENDVEDITRYSEPLKNVQWFSDYEHIIFTAGRWTKMIELDSRDRRNSMDIVGAEIQNPFVIFNEPLGKIYFTDLKENSTGLFSITFPEETSILGILN